MQRNLINTLTFINLKKKKRGGYTRMMMDLLQNELED